MTARRHIAVVMAALALASCGTSPPSRYYLPEPVAPAAPTVGVGPIVFVDELNVAAYADRPQFVTRVDDLRVTYEEFDVWAEPVQGLLTAYLVDALGNRFGRNNVLATPPGRPFDPDYRLSIDLHRLDTTEDGTVVLDASWMVFTGPGDRFQERGRERFTTMLPAAAGAEPPINQDDRARAFAALLDRLADTIAADLR